jgi:hypothetical protein
LTDAARRLGVSPKILRKAVRSKALPAYQLTDRWLRVFWPEVITWVQSQQVRPTPHAQQRVAEILKEERQRDGRAGP